MNRWRRVRLSPISTKRAQDLSILGSHFVLPGAKSGDRPSATSPLANQPAGDGVYTQVYTRQVASLVAIRSGLRHVASRCSDT